MKRLIFIIPAVLVFLGSCAQTAIDASDAGTDVEGVSVRAYFALPPWDAPKTLSQARVVDPTSAIVTFSAEGTPLGEFAMTVDANNIGSVTVTGLEARTYAAGSLYMQILDAEYTTLTEGENIDDITLTSQGTNTIEFSSVPFGATAAAVSDSAVSASLPDGAAIYYEFSVIGGNTYSLTGTRTSATGDLDLYAFDGYGRLVNDEYGLEAQDETLTLYLAPQTSGTYYFAARAFSGSGAVDFDYDLADVSVAGQHALSGTVTFPAATAGDVAHLSLGGYTYEKAVGRTGDTKMRYVFPGIPDATSGIFSVYVDRDGDAASSVDDYKGNTSSSISVNGHTVASTLALSLAIGVRGTISVPVNETGSRMALVAIDASTGWPIGSYSMTTQTYNSTTVYETFGKVGTVRILYVFDVDGSGSELTSVATWGDLNTLVTDGDYGWLSGEVTLVSASASGIDGTAGYFDMAGYAAFSDWLAAQ